MGDGSRRDGLGGFQLRARMLVSLAAALAVLAVRDELLDGDDGQAVLLGELFDRIIA